MPPRTDPGPLVPPVLPPLSTATVLVGTGRETETTGDLHRIRGDLYAASDPDAPPAVARRDLVLARVAATRAALDTRFWFSGPTAALLHGLWTYRLGDAVHLTQLHPPQVRREPGSWDHRNKVTRHWTALPVRDRAVVRGVPVTSVERTAVDCARMLPLAPALVAMDCALRHGADPRLIGEILRESRGKRGVVQAREVLRRADPGAESPGETLVRLIAVEQRLGPVATQIPVHTRLGTRWIDVGWPRSRVGIEFDGAVKYTDLAGGDPEEVRRRERRRQDAIEEAGWHLERADWNDVERDAPFVRRVRAAVAGRRHAVAG